MPALLFIPGTRINAENINHHLWDNNGTWFLHYTVYPTAFTKERVRHSLGTKDLTVARERRDVFFAARAASAAKPVSAPPLPLARCRPETPPSPAPGPFRSRALP